MIKKLFEKWNRFINSDHAIETKIFQLVTMCGILGSLAGAVMSAVIGLDILIVLITFMGTIGITILYYIGMKWNKIEVSSCVMALFLCCVYMPTIFFTGGGILSGVNVWVVLCLFSLFLLLKGKMLVVVFAISVGVMVVIYMIAYHNPEYVIVIDNEWDIYMDVMDSIVLVALICGFFVIFQSKIYKKEQKKVMEQNHEIAQLYQAKNRFFANMSHEIRTPINSIIGLNEMILREEISDEIAENAVHIQEASKMLLALINDILDISKLESGKMEIVPMQYETGRMFSELVNLIWIRAHDKKLEFRVDVSPDLPSMLFGDEVRIKQIVTNLLTNAVKYTSKGSVTLIARGEQVDNNRIELTISVKDTGIGIKKEDMQNLFQSFRRMDERANAKIEGTGLGLSISGQLAEMMGGKITVDSIYQRGSVFTLQIEQKIVDLSPMGHMDFMLRDAAGRRKKYKQSFEAPEARVLLVDDNETNLLVVKKLLRDTKVQIDTAKSGKECLELTKKIYYHVIFMDQLMPEMGGPETLSKLRDQEDGLCRNVPVVALTANVMTGAEQIYMDIGFNGYLAKPINGSLLEATLLKYLPKELLEYYDIPTEEDKNEYIHVFSQAKKKKIHITTDCICDLPKEYIKHYGIGVMHYYINIDQARFADGKEISSNNLVEYLENSHAEISSECASVEEYESFFAKAFDVGEQIIHISASEKASFGFKTASLAAQGFDNVTVVDSGHTSSGLGMIVLYVADMAEKGCSVQEIIDKIELLREQICTSFIVPSVEHMYQNGKVSKEIKNICDILGVHLIFSLKKGSIVPIGIGRGKRKSAYYRYIRKILKGNKHIDPRLLFITYSGCMVKQVNEIKDEVEKYQNFEHIVMHKSSATISSNCGLGAIGIIYMKKY